MKQLSNWVTSLPPADYNLRGLSIYGNVFISDIFRLFSATAFLFVCYLFFQSTKAKLFSFEHEFSYQEGRCLRKQ
jgi:hypothetical protein